MKNKGKKAIGLLVVILALLLGVLSGSVWADGRTLEVSKQVGDTSTSESKLTVKIGDTSYNVGSLQALFTDSTVNVQDGDTIKFTTDNYYVGGIVDIKKSVTIDFQNSTVYHYGSNSAKRLFKLYSSGTVSISNVTIDGSKFSGTVTDHQAFYVTRYNENNRASELILSNSTIKNFKGQAVLVNAVDDNASYTTSVTFKKVTTSGNGVTVNLQAYPWSSNQNTNSKAIFNYDGDCSFGEGTFTSYDERALAGFKNHLVNNITTGVTTDLLPAEITITANDQTIKYGESLKTEPAEEVVTITTGLTEGDSLSSITLTPSTTEITSNGTITPSAAKILSGETDVTNSYKITYAPGKLVIVESDSAVVTAPTVKSYLVYTGEEQELINAGSATGGTMKYAVTQSAEPVPEDSAFLAAVPTGTEAGTYYVWYKVFGNAGHKDGEKISLGMVTISPASMIYKTEGAEYEKGSDQQSAQLKIEFTDEETNEKALEYFQSASVGGRTLTRDVDYIARKGSVEIILQHDYLEGLDVGEYQLIAEFNIDGDQFSIPVPFVVTAPIDAEISNYQSDGSKGIPEGVKDLDVILQFLIKQGDKTVAASSPTVFAVKDGIMEKSHTILFNAKLKTELTNEYTVEVKVLSPKSVEVPLGIYDNQTKEELTQSYTLSATAWPHNGKITVQLRWDDGKDHSVPELKVYALPEDEIGAYAMRKDGTKEYLLFHTYSICMDYLGRDDLCRGYERCFHKESPYVNPFVKP